MGPLVSVEWLADHLQDPGLIVLDANMKPVGAAAQASPPAPVRLPGARRFDFDHRICDTDSPLPHMMPSTEVFEREVRALGVNQDSFVVVYDRVGTYSSPRAWWMLKAMGHDRVAVLDGGLPAWQRAGLPVEAGEALTSGPNGNFVARKRPEYFLDAAQVEAALADPRTTVIDARSQGRFEGRDPEPRPGLRSGHMPGARNVPFDRVQKQGQMLTVKELAELFASRARADQKLIFSCGSGVTACVLALAAELAGRKNLSVYDGSWSEWGLPSSRPVVTGPEE